MRYAIVPSPCPLFAPVISIHAVAVVADHVQSRAVVTASDPVAPVDGAVPVSEFAMVTEHLLSLGPVTAIVDDARPQESATAASAHAANSRARIAPRQSANRLPWCAQQKRKLHGDAVEVP